VQNEIIVVFSKAPIVGKVKSRLAVDIGEEAALSIHQQLFAHTQSIVEQTGIPSTTYFTEPPLIPFHKPWSVQHGVELGERMANAFEYELNHNHKVCLIGSDCFDINTDDLSEAMSSLDQFDLIIGPARDGGYYLIGMKKSYPELFHHINWGTDAVFRQTIAIAKQLGLKFYVLQERTDIDTIEDIPAGWEY